MSGWWWWSRSEEDKPKSKSKKKNFRILALDGGGVRAIIQSTILHRLVEHYPDLLDDVDLIAGTSAGSIVAAALAVGLSPKQISELWEKEVGKIFTESWYHRMSNLNHAIGACYENTSLKELLHGMVGDTQLKDLKKGILVPSFDLDPQGHSIMDLKSNVNKNKARWHPEYFHNLSNSENAESLLSEVVLRSTAAPTYFPIHDAYVDGGTFANNPSLAAVSSAIASGVKLEDISVLSISTGCNPKSLSAKDIGTGDWGLFEWGPQVIQLLLDATTGSIDYDCKCLLHEEYCRVDPILQTDVPLDDASAVPDLIEMANKYNLKPIRDWLDAHWHPTKLTDLCPEEQMLKLSKMEEPIPSNYPGRCAIQ